MDENDTKKSYLTGVQSYCSDSNHTTRQCSIKRKTLLKMIFKNITNDEISTPDRESNEIPFQGRASHPPWYEKREKAKNRKNENRI